MNKNRNYEIAWFVGTDDALIKVSLQRAEPLGFCLDEFQIERAWS